MRQSGSLFAAVALGCGSMASIGSGTFASARQWGDPMALRRPSLAHGQMVRALAVGRGRPRWGAWELEPGRDRGGHGVVRGQGAGRPSSRVRSPGDLAGRHLQRLVRYSLNHTEGSGGATPRQRAIGASAVEVVETESAALRRISLFRHGPDFHRLSSLAMAWYRERPLYGGSWRASVPDGTTFSYGRTDNGVVCRSDCCILPRTQRLAFKAVIAGRTCHFIPVPYH